MYLWLDDVRTAPDHSWTWATTVEDAIYLLSLGGVEVASLDHDLGLDPSKFHDYTEGRISEQDAEMTGYQVVLWMAETDTWPSEAVYVHSMNPVGAKRMCGVVDRYGPYSAPCKWIQAP